MDVFGLRIAYMEPLVIKNTYAPKIRRARGHRGLERAAVGFLTQMACWGNHVASGLSQAYHGNRARAEREVRIAGGCLRRARIIQVELHRLLDTAR
jgi:hypothetical protein